MEASDYNATEHAASNGAGSGQSPWAAQETATSASGRPEIPVIAAFVGGFIFAKLLQKLGGDDE